MTDIVQRAAQPFALAEQGGGVSGRGVVMQMQCSQTLDFDMVSARRSDGERRMSALFREPADDGAGQRTGRRNKRV